MTTTEAIRVTLALAWLAALVALDVIGAAFEAGWLP